jgi:hypothetical protein
MGVPTLEFGYTSATTGMGDHEVHKGHVVALGYKTYRVSFLSRPRQLQLYRAEGQHLQIAAVL